MGIQLFTNNAVSQLSGTLPQGGTTLVCSVGQGAKFPTPIGGDFFYLTLYTKDVYANEQEIEVVKVTARATDTFTIERDIELITGQSGGFAYNGGTTTVYLEMRWTAGCVSNMAQKDELADVATSGDYADLLNRPPAYTHPTNHSPSIITQDASNRFVSDAEKTAWNAKQPAGTYATGTGSASGVNTGDQDLSGKQNVLVSGTSIKTINATSLLGSGDISIGGSDTSAASSIYSASNFRGF